ncbi:MAG: Uncharacterized conserved protein, DUF1501 family [Verrucomicrobia bacterium]|jgi:hypothetical protein|nr:MAG: Uncharacterized conserved protein, DUF1501 family [Verrucomicrobiota bacterium]
MESLIGPKFSRRRILPGLSVLGDVLALGAEQRLRPARHLILLWLEGAPSQLETFDPHAGRAIAHGSTDIVTSAAGVRIGSGLAQTAEVMHQFTLVRSMVTREGDHERAVFNMKTGYRPNPALLHPAIGAIFCHELPHSPLEIPTHISILPNRWPARGGFLGGGFDAFQLGDPQNPLPDMRASVSGDRESRRMAGLSVIEEAFVRGQTGLEAKTLHRTNLDRARRMMSSEQLRAFNVAEEPAAIRAAYGDTPFGRGCLAARRLVEVGVPCVEVTLDGWDTHVNNHELQAARIQILDPALATLIRDLQQRDLLDRTVVFCGGEFGRTPRLNAVEGRDHWPRGFSIALAGGGFGKGRVHGETDPAGTAPEPASPVRVEDLHATLLTSLGVDPAREVRTPVGRPLQLSEGRVIGELLAGR